VTEINTDEKTVVAKSDFNVANVIAAIALLLLCSARSNISAYLQSELRWNCGDSALIALNQHHPCRCFPS
jgi:hypothetical protein